MKFTKIIHYKIECYFLEKVQKREMLKKKNSIKAIHFIRVITVWIG